MKGSVLLLFGYFAMGPVCCFGQLWNNQFDSLDRKMGPWSYPFDATGCPHPSLREAGQELDVYCTYVNDTLDGRFWIADENHMVRYEKSYVMGKSHGPAFVWDEKGRLQMTLLFADRKALLITDFIGSRAWSTREYDKNDSLRREIVLRRSGVPRRESQFEGGKLVGEYEYDRRGWVKVEWMYDHEGRLLKRIKWPKKESPNGFARIK